MRILVINYRYFVSGGPERYMFNLKDLLEENGHEVVPFSIQYDRNEPTEYARYFAPPLGDGSEVYFRDQSPGISTYLRTIERAFYSRDVYGRLRELIDDVRPDVAVVQHYLRKLSPSVLKALADGGVPFVVRLSDFAMVCPNAHLIRDAKPCELCVHGSLRHSVRYRCVQGSLAASAVNYAATRFHQARGYFDLIPRFVVPTRFTLEKMVEGGYDRGRLVHVPTFVTGGPAAPTAASSTIAYVGRLEHLKGVHHLLEAVRLVAAGDRPVDLRVRIMGTGEPDYVDGLTRFVADHDLEDIVAFEGMLPREEVGEILRSALVSVVPSLWYENMPNSALESMVEGTPVIAPGHGCFPEIVRNGETGTLYAPEDSVALAHALRAALSDPQATAAMGQRAAEFVRVEHSPEGHYAALMQTLQAVGAESRHTSKGELLKVD